MFVMSLVTLIFDIRFDIWYKSFESWYGNYVDYMNKDAKETVFAFNVI